LGTGVRPQAVCLVILAASGCSISHTPIQANDRQKGESEKPRSGRAKGEANVETMHARKRKPAPQDAARLNELAGQLHAEPFTVDNPCVSDACPRNALDRLFARFDEIDQRGEGTVRILHLGDSHVAADYITGTVRKWLQHRFGLAGRGFVAIDQRAEFGGRRLHRKGWRRTRIVDKGREGSAMGFAGMSLESQRSGARVDFRIDPEDAAVTVFYQTHKSSARLRVLVNDKVVGELDVRARDIQTLGKTFRLPPVKGESSSETLAIVAEDPGIKLFGVSFESERPGVFYDTVGPVGADARAYLALERKSFRDHLRALKPDLVVIMLGGNDALGMRKGERTLADVRTDHEKLISAIQDAVPDADCMLWSPMDAGEMQGSKIVSKQYISEVRNMQKAAATNRGCAFWDMFESMGGVGSFARWHEAGIMNDDLVHPRKDAGALLGHLFATSLLDAWLSSGGS
jgi:hypothetical protein